MQLLEAHHKNNNHHDNPPDGSNWEPLCTYCHENEHSRLKDMAGRSDGASAVPSTTFKAFTNLKSMLTFKKSLKPKLNFTKAAKSARVSSSRFFWTCR